LKKEIIKPGIIRSIIQKMDCKNNEVVSEETVDSILNAFFDTIIEALENGDSIKLKGYMTIYPKLYKAKNVHNVADNEIISIPKRYKARINAGSKLNNACKNLLGNTEE